MSDLAKQATKCVNEFVERAGGNFGEAEKLWLAEMDALPHPKNAYMKQYIYVVAQAFRIMRPKSV